MSVTQNDGQRLITRDASHGSHMGHASGGHVNGRPAQGRKSAPAPVDADEFVRRAEAFKAVLKTNEATIRDLLPTTAKLQHFVQVCETAVLGDRRLLFRFEPQQLLPPLIKCARFGLLPDKTDAVLVPYKNEDTGEVTVDLQVMYQGVLKRLRATGETTSVSAEAVYQKDTFRADTLALTIVYEKFLDGDPGALIGGCAVFRNKQREIVHIEVLRKRDIDTIRSKAKTQKVWNAFPDEKVRISAIRRGSKYIPMSDDSRELLALDDAFVDLNKADQQARIGHNSHHLRNDPGRAATLDKPAAALKDMSRAEIEKFLAEQPEDADVDESGDGANTNVNGLNGTQAKVIRSPAATIPASVTASTQDEPFDDCDDGSASGDRDASIVVTRDDAVGRNTLDTHAEASAAVHADGLALVIEFRKALGAAEGPQWRKAVGAAYNAKISQLEKIAPELYQLARETWKIAVAEQDADDTGETP